MDTVETDALYASFPDTPDKDKKALTPSHSSRSVFSLMSDIAGDRSTDKTSPSSDRIPLSPSRDRAVISVTEFDDDNLPSSVDITSPSINWPTFKDEQTKTDSIDSHMLPASHSQRSALSITIDELLNEQEAAALSASLSEEIPPDGMDIVDLSPPPSPQHETLALEYMPGGSPPDFHSNDHDFDTTQVRVTPLASSPSSVDSSSSPRSPHRVIPRVVVDSFDAPDPSFSFKPSTSLSPPRPLNLGHSLGSSNSVGRLSVSVLPEFDETTDLIERTLLQIQKQRHRLSGGGLEDGSEGEGSGDDDDLDSFEGDVSFVRSPAYSPRSDRMSDEERAEEDEADRHWIAVHDHYGYPEDDDDAGNRSFIDELGFESDIGVHGRQLVYPSDYNYHPRIPRPAEVARRAIAREGRAPDADRALVYSSPYGGAALNQNSKPFAPAVSSPLRVVHRAASRCSDDAGSRNSDGSMYSQVSEATGGMNASGTGWSSVF